MDPTPNYCKIYDSFNLTPTLSVSDNVNYYTGADNPGFKEYLNTNIDKKKYNCDTVIYEKIEKLKKSFNNPDFLTISRKLNPFDKLGNSVFISKDAVKLGNVDAVIPFTGVRFTPLLMQDNIKLTFCDLAGAPGAFSQYIKYRYPNAVGYGISPIEKNQSLNWKRDVLGKNYNIFYGGDNSGDLLKVSDQFINFVLNDNEGVDLVTANAGIDGIHQDDEYNMSSFLLSECYIALHVLKYGGYLVIKTYSTVSMIVEHIIYLLSTCFEKIAFIKPISSRPDTSEKYLVCLNINNNIEKQKKIFKNAYLQIKKNKNLSGLIDHTPDDFKKWLTYNNNLFLKQQHVACSSIYDAINGKEIDTENYNLSKIFTLWSLPDNKTKKDDLIKAYY